MLTRGTRLSPRSRWPASWPRRSVRKQRRRPVTSCAAWVLPEAGPFGRRVDPERGAVQVRQPVDGQAPGNVVHRGPGPGNLRVVGAPVRQEVLAEPGPDQLGKGNTVPQADRERDGVGAGQARAAGAVLAPVEEDLAQASVVVLVGGEVEPFRADGHGRGVSAAAPRHGSPDTKSHHSSSEIIYELSCHRAVI